MNCNEQCIKTFYSVNKVSVIWIECLYIWNTMIHLLAFIDSIGLLLLICLSGIDICLGFTKQLLLSKVAPFRGMPAFPCSIK
jgi:hypothetical protein